MKSFDLNFTDPKYASFLFFIFSLWRLSNHFCQRSYEKTNQLHNDYQKYSFFLHFYKDLISRNFWQWNDSLFKSMKKLRFLASDFEFYKFFKYDQKYFDSERLWYSKLSLLKLRIVELAILDLKSLWKSIKSWELLIFVMKTGGFFINLW